MKRNVRSINIISELKNRFGNGLKPELQEVIIFHKENNVFCELIFSKEARIENVLNDLSFIHDNEGKCFEVTKGIETNISDFLKLDNYTMLLAADEMFTDIMKEEILNYEYTDEFDKINNENNLTDTHDEDVILNITIENSNIINLKDILISAENEPTYDKDGYSEYRIVFNEITPTIPLEKYNLISTKRCYITSRLYHRYLDQKTIVFKALYQKMLWFEPKNDESICLKGSGLFAYKIKNELEKVYYLEYIYLHLMHPKFYEQFKESISSENILEGWIPNASYEKQVEFSKRMRKKAIEDISDAQIILGIA